MFALTQLASKKTSSTEEKSFLVNSPKKKSKKTKAESMVEEKKIFFIKDLDSNKIELIDHDEKVEKIIGELDQLPEIESLL